MRAGNATGTPASAPCSTCSALGGLLAFLLRLNIFPQAFDGLWIIGVLVTEHMRMPANKLRRNCLNHVAKVEAALFLRHAGVKDDLQQQITKLVLKVVQIIARDRVGDLVGLLDRIRRDAREVLLQIPRAAGLGRAQRSHDFDEPVDVA